MEIKISNLNKSYKKVQALTDINLEFESPSIIGLIGPNGAGKTTLMRILVGQLLFESGNISVDGKDILKDIHNFKQRLGYLPQDYELYNELTVEEFIDYMACLKGIDSDRKSIVNECIVKTNITNKRKSKIKSLSGGQRQRVGIAQALLNDPEILIVDEPTAGLDPEERIKFRNMFSQQANKKIVILSTHIIDDVESICNKLIVLHKGRIIFAGNPTDLIKEAVNHVGIIEIPFEEKIDESKLKIISAKLTENGYRYRVVGENIPDNFKKASPSLEDAYIYSMQKKDKSVKIKVKS